MKYTIDMNVTLWMVSVVAMSSVIGVCEENFASLLNMSRENHFTAYNFVSSCGPSTHLLLPQV